MTIDSLDCIGDVAEDFEDNLLKNFLDIPLWNGREVEYLTKILEREFLIAFIHSFSNRLEINKPDSFLEANIENLYPNNLKNWEFDKEAPQNFCSERPTQSKTDSSSCLGIKSHEPTLVLWALQKMWGIVQTELETIKYNVPIPEILDPHLPLCSFLKQVILEESRCYQTEGDRFEGMKITFINGIANTFNEAITSAEHIRKLGPNLAIDGIYNKSNTPIFDVLEIFTLNYWGFSPSTQNLLSKEWTDFHIQNKDNPNAKILHFCHSQGTLHTFNTLLVLPQEIRDRIIVISIAPAQIVPGDFCYRSYNYVSKNDLIHHVEDMANSYKVWLCSDDAIANQMTALFNQYKSELIFLEPHENAEWIDHMIRSPTFFHVIEEHSTDYKNHRGEYIPNVI